LRATYVILVIYVSVLMITYVVALYLLLRPLPKTVRAVARRCSGILDRIRREWIVGYLEAIANR
jgi:hypothetical protein